MAGELAHEGGAVLGLEIGLDRALAAVRRVEIGGRQVLARGPFEEGRPPAAGVVAGAGALDLDDVGAEVGEELPDPRAGENPRQLQDLHAFKRLHACAHSRIASSPRLRPTNEPTRRAASSVPAT